MTPVADSPRRRWRLIAGTAAMVTALCIVVPASAHAQDTAASIYKGALARETALATTDAPTLSTYRSIITAYESVVRKFPQSGYCDDALWHGSAVALEAFKHFGNDADRQRGVQLAQRIKKEYPTSPFVKQIDTRVAEFAAVKTKSPASASSAKPSTATAPAAGTTPAASNPASPAAASAVAATPAKPVAPSPAPSTPTKAPAATTPAANATPPPAAAGPKAAPVSPAAATSAPTPAAPPSPAPSKPALTGSISLSDIQLTTLPKGERLTISLSGETEFSSAHIAAPDRITVKLTNTSPASGLADKAAAVAGALITAVHVTTIDAQTTQVAIDLASHPHASLYPIYNPYRLVLDVETTGPVAPLVPSKDAATVAKSPAIALSMQPASASNARIGVSVTSGPSDPSGAAKTSASMSSATNAPTTAGDHSAIAPVSPPSTVAGGYSLSRQLGLGVSRIVIDPGHGGHDPGAQANGINESELTLDVALRLEQLLLAQPGLQVVLTRRTDEFIPLEERTAIANREGADLFISIHANASDRPVARGIETYLLNFSSNPAAEAVAARENATSEKTMGSLPELVKAITLNNKLTESRELATLVQDSMVRRLKASNAGLRDLGVKQAPFVVLIGAQMPSVLAEISFLTNRVDAGLLKDSDYRQRIAQSLSEAIPEIPNVAEACGGRRREVTWRDGLVTRPCKTLSRSS